MAGCGAGRCPRKPACSATTATTRGRTVLGNRDRALTLGLNWYLSPHLKLQSNVIRDALYRSTSAEEVTRPSYWSGVLRLQMAM